MKLIFEYTRKYGPVITNTLILRSKTMIDKDEYDIIENGIDDYDNSFQPGSFGGDSHVYVCLSQTWIDRKYQENHHIITTIKSLNAWNTPLLTTLTVLKPMKTILTPHNKHKQKIPVTTPDYTQQIDTFSPLYPLVSLTPTKQNPHPNTNKLPTTLSPQSPLTHKQQTYPYIPQTMFSTRASI